MGSDVLPAPQGCASGGKVSTTLPPLPAASATAAMDCCAAAMSFATEATRSCSSAAVETVLFGACALAHKGAVLSSQRPGSPVNAAAHMTSFKALPVASSCEINTSRKARARDTGASVALDADVPAQRAPRSKASSGCQRMTPQSTARLLAALRQDFLS